MQWLCLLVVWLLTASVAQAELAIVRVLDPPATLTPDYLRNNASLSLQPASALLHPTPSQRSLWRITLGADPALAAGTAVLALGQTTDRGVTLYLPPDFAPMALNLHDPNYRTTNARDTLVIALSPQLQAGAQLWLEVQNPRAVPISVAVRDRTAQARINANNVRFYTAMMVLMLACCSVAASFYFVLREPIWLLYIVKTLGYWIYLGARTGEFASIADSASWPWLIPHMGMGLGNAAALFAAGVAAFFFVRFVDVAQYTPRMGKSIRVIGSLMIAFSPLAFMAGGGTLSAIIRYSNLLLIANALLVACASLYAIKKGNRSALYFLIAELPLMATLFLQIGAGLGFLAFPELSNRLFMAGHAFSGVVISLGLAHQVLRYREQRDEAIASSERDMLTGALNRRAVTAALNAALNVLDPRRGSVCVCFLDLDLFKQVNDKFGHHLGDEALKLLVREAQAELRGSDLLARLGGEEFLLVLPGAHLNDGLMVSERIRARIQSHGAVIERQAVNLTVSIGVAASSNRLHSADALIDAADQALYRAKRTGRNRVEAMNIVELSQQNKAQKNKVQA
jgi:diguanylate cyclase (GGDEF)-like protein